MSGFSLSSRRLNKRLPMSLLDDSRTCFARNLAPSREWCQQYNVSTFFSAGLRWAAVWTLGLTIVAAVAAFLLQSLAPVHTLAGLIYIVVGVVIAPGAYVLGGFCTDSQGCCGFKNDLQCQLCLWSCILFPATLVFGGCLLFFQTCHHVLVYMLPALPFIVLPCGRVIIELTVRDTDRNLRYASPSTDPLGVPLV